MNVSYLMTRKIICADLDSTLFEVASLLIDNRIHAVPIVEKNDMKLMGIITETDLVLKDECARYLNHGTLKYEHDVNQRIGRHRHLASEEMLEVRASDIMSKGCQTINPELNIDELITTFRRTQFHSLPVTQSGDILVGIVTISDILKLY